MPDGRDSPPPGTAPRFTSLVRKSEYREERSGNSDLFDRIILGILALLIIFPSLALGSVAPWAQSAAFLMALIILSLQGLAAVHSGRVSIPESRPLLVVTALFGALALLQVLPLPDPLLGLLSPGALDLHRWVPSGPAGMGTISLSPHATGLGIRRLATFAIVFFAALGVLRTRRRIAVLLAAFVTLGSFEALYGLAETFSGSGNIFWVERDTHLEAVTGTFLNKNYFAALLAMTLPVCLGLLFAAGKGAREKHSRFSPDDGAGKEIAAGISSPSAPLQIILASLAVVMLTALFLSLSRGGVAVTFLAFAFFTVIAGRSSRFRRYTVLMAVVAMLVVAVTASIGMEKVIGGLEDAATGHSESWRHRSDIYRSALDLGTDFPLLGTGFGTMGDIFARYRSRQNGDTAVLWVHSDWLQLFCEGGVTGLVIVLAALGIIVAGLVKSLKERRDPWALWVGRGCLIGALAILAYGTVEHSLSKCTSHGILLSILLAAGWAAASLRGREARLPPTMRSIDLGTPLRIAVAAVSLGILVWGGTVALRTIAADIAFSRHLVALGEKDDYFFLPLGPADSPDESLRRAMELDPGNPRTLFYAGIAKGREADVLVRAEGERLARQLTGEGFAKKDRKVYDQLVDTLTAELTWRRPDVRAPLVGKGEAFFAAATAAAPAAAPYRIHRADALLELDPFSPVVVRETERALSLAPNVPSVNFNAGRIFLLRSNLAAAVGEKEELREKAAAALRHAVAVDPSYTALVLPLAEAALGGIEGLGSLVPRSLRAYEGLYEAYRRAAAWEMALDTLEAIDHLALERAAGSGEDYSSVDIGYDRRSLEEIRLSVARRRAQVFGLTGEWRMRAEAAALYRDLAVGRTGEDLERARRLRARGRSSEAAALCRDILRRDWWSPGPALMLAELTSLPHLRGAKGEGGDPLEPLERLVIGEGILEPGEYEQFVEVLAAFRPRGPGEELRAAFLGGAAAILAGKAGEGIAVLRPLAGGGSAGAWEQRHLPWYFLGRGYEASGDREEALAAYRRAVQNLPSHRPSLSRLLALGEDVAPALSRLTPERATNIPFGGLITWLGYDGEENGTLKLYWQVGAGLGPEASQFLHFSDGNWEYLSHSERPLSGTPGKERLGPLRSGEVIILKGALPAPPPSFVGIGVRAVAAKAGETELLFHDVGERSAALVP